ncbi:MAG: rhomboid family intramembrane serine protease [Deltaproteobacteria bacterium]|nr:rhomboid family intramembrane serine protease [Deltaproteobacteria bacterium]
MTQAGREIIVRRTPDLRQAEEWSLVLEAEGLAPRLTRTSSGWVLSVPSQHLEQAVTELWDYESETRTSVPDEEPWPGHGPLYTGAGVGAALLAFFFFAAGTQGTVPWLERGSASADLILRGELWRTVTALTLHADLAHVGSNAVAMLFFLTAVCRSEGPGLGAAMVLAVGAGGNLCNAWFYGFDHISIGASTAVFGALGVVGGTGVVRRQRLGLRGKRAWIPLAAGLAILAMLGTGGQRVDLWAHLWGFAVGGAGGAALATAMDRPENPRIQVRIGVLAAGVVALCWFLAFS